MLACLGLLLLLENEARLQDAIVARARARERARELSEVLVLSSSSSDCAIRCAYELRGDAK